MRREVILGPPGTGKTEEMMRRLEAAFRAGIAPEQVAYLAFTKKAAEVALLRAAERFGWDVDRFLHFRTLHSLAFKAQGLNSRRVLTEERLRDFGQAHGWEFSTKIGDQDGEPRYGVGLGDQLLRAYDMARARGCSVVTSAAIDGVKLPAGEVEYFADQLDRWKAKNDLLSFGDFLESPVALPGLRLVIIDEAQDLTAQQWAFVKRSFHEVPEILFAGDDDQAIYQWSGADIAQFLSLPAERTQLTKTYRCRRRIWEVCNQVATRITKRYVKAWEPASEGGVIEYHQIGAEVDISAGEWLILARTNQRKQRYWHTLMRSGRVFHDGLRWINEAQWFVGALAYIKLQRDESVSPAEGAAMVKLIPGARAERNANRLHAQDFSFPFRIEERSWLHACSGLAQEQVAFLARAIKLDEPMKGPGQVRLSTIHGAKGGEADNVLLDSFLGGHPLRQFERDPDAERRVWYVGISRARHRLAIVGAGRQNRALEGL